MNLKRICDSKVTNQSTEYYQVVGEEGSKFMNSICEKAEKLGYSTETQSPEELIIINKDKGAIVLVEGYQYPAEYSLIVENGNPVTSMEEWDSDSDWEAEPISSKEAWRFLKTGKLPEVD